MTHIAWFVCWTSALLLVHVFVGYPLIVWLQARLRPRPVARQAILPRVSIVVAVHDGERYLRAKLVNLRQLDYPSELVEIVLVCDGCHDGTVGMARRSTDPRLTVIEHPERRGKAECLNDAVAASTGDVLLFTDIRQRLSPVALRELVANLGDPTVGAVGGELHMENVRTGFAQGVDFYWRYEKTIRHAESLSGSTIGVSGALYAMRRSLFRPLPPGTVLDDVLVPMRVAAQGKRVVFEPRAMAWDQPSQVPEDERRRKIRTLAGNFQLMQLAPWLLAPWSNPLWFRFVSHKVLRLLAPWLIVALTVSSGLLVTRHPMYALAFGGLVGGLLLVGVARLRPPLGRLLPLRIAVAFFYLNLFAAQALLAFARNRRLHLW
ncbi:Glycosyltransferase, catalytic subunit of cellulose synthase and poly-beta-1,6-N-acetylglucosamine synthase [Luteibacter sp. UNC138MFCol5.1]|uniref:glycosyltransferase family 2 protein n=1 Tax=Luteibacter sp. UNC138MFCol5.1 TaxID=1502774 RepID=UPI0008D4B525|nr:glycosyltransferase family 2 protein [Luteibacter sp. UNC138MFCol5.1]SEO95542.1 Glycosyltransferase, catalytic subunit of cellulose synthase and poly-beta-1,6-N-acetylglucosamine synthase [Luteibacter sp. UNC138MFCol5.1]